MRQISWLLFLLSTYISDGVKQSGHSLPSFQLCLLHGFKFDKNRVNLGHDAADGVFHAIHAAAETETQWCKAFVLLLLSSEKLL